MEPQLRLGLSETAEALKRRAAQLIADAHLEALLLLLLLLTIAAVAWQDRILLQSYRFTPQSIASLARTTHSDATIGGKSTATETGPLAWACELREGFGYPYCGYDLFFSPDRSENGLHLTNFQSMSITLVYRGPAKSFRVYLKNFDKRYAKDVMDDSPKINRVEYDVTPGMPQTVTFDVADWGVADWWLFKHKLPPALSHPQFDNVTSIDIQTGTETKLGRHEFEVRDIVLRNAMLNDSQYYLALLGAWIVIIGLYLGFRIRTMKNELHQRAALHALAMRHAEVAEEEARQDHLTRLLNRRGIAERYAALSDDRVAPVPLAAILIDIDRFKSLNDRFGHIYGDEVLFTIATLVRRSARPEDSVCRWGGEEFLLLCPGVDSNEAEQIAEKVRRRIEHFDFGDCEQVTASFGIHWCPAPGPELQELVARADVALYSAKNSGRNCCRVYRPGMAKAA